MATHNYRPLSRTTCPHCLTSVRFEETRPNLDVAKIQGPTETLGAISAACPQCGKVVLTIGPGHWDESKPNPPFKFDEQYIVWPLQATRPVPPEVPDHIAADYKEAAITLSFSPKASAALSRRCLEIVLVEAGGAKEYLLSKKIDEVMPTLPSYIAESIDGIRNIGNLAAHPTKDQTTGIIVDVEPGEAEWNLDVLDMLFDHYYVKPAQAKQKRDALDAKLDAAGKRPMK